MADNQEPDIARRLGGGGNRQGVGGSGEAVAQKLQGAFKAVADNAAKAYKSLSDMEKVVDRINQKTRSSLAFGGGGGGTAGAAGRGNAGSPAFGGIRSALGGASGGAGGAATGGSGGIGGNGGHLNLGLSGFGGAPSSPAGGGGAAAATAMGAPGGAAGGGNILGGALGKMGPAGQVGAAAFKALSGYGQAHLQDAATMELASSRLAIAGGSQGLGNREAWRAGRGLADMGGYNLDDNTSAALTLSGLGALATPGQGAFGQYQAQVSQMTGQFGGLGANQAASFLQQAQSTQSQFAGRRLGIPTTGAGGRALGPDQIAQNILKRYRGHAAVGSQRYQEDISASLQQGAGLSNTIGSLGLDSESQDLVTQDIQLLAAGKNPTTDAPKNHLDKQTKSTAKSQLETTSATAKGIADGAADIKAGAEMFRNAVNKLLKKSGLGGLVGVLSGAAGQLGGPTVRSNAVTFGGAQSGGPIKPGNEWQGIEDGVRKLGFSFGTPTPGQVNSRSGGDHGAGRAVDFGDATSDSHAIAQALVPYATGPNAAISQLIFAKDNIGYDSGSNKGEAFYGPGTWAAHMNHVHVAVKPGVNLAEVVANGPGSGGGGGGGGNSSSSSAPGGGGGGAASPGITNSAGDLISQGETGSMLGVSAPGRRSSSSSNSSSDGGGGGGVPGGPPATGPLQDYAKKLLGQYGWSDQWDSFNKLEMSEGGWDPTVSNGETPGGSGHRGPHGVAYGIPQALPPEKMASAGADWATSGYTQLRWMMEYIKTKGSFHDPNSAWAYHQRNNSYAQGSWEIERDQYARIHAGEMIVPAEQAQQIRLATGGRGSGAGVTINVSVQNASESEVMRLVQRVKTELSRDNVLDLIGKS